MIIQRIAEWLSSWLRRPVARRVGLALAGILFVGGLLLSLRAISLDDLTVNWLYIAVLIIVGAPLTLALNTLVFWLSAESVCGSYTLSGALRLTIISSAANFLPLPGGAVVRISALRMSGSSYKAAISITSSAAILWLFVALLIAGAGLAHIRSQPNYYLLCVLGLALGILAFTVACSTTRSATTALTILWISIATHLVATLRFWLSFGAIGLTLPIMDTAIIAASGTAGAVVGIVPGGLGVNEAMAALLTDLTGHVAATGFIAATLNRLANYAVRGPLALAIIWKERP